MGFLKRSSGEKQPSGEILSSSQKRPAPPDPDVAAIAQLRRAGADPSVPHQTRHFIYVPGVKTAQHLAHVLKNPQRHIEIDTSARAGYWLVVVRQSMVVTPDAIAALRKEFEAAALPLGGEYDRWQVDLEGG